MSCILVVDDDTDSRDAVERFLRRSGHRVLCAGNGREAIAALGEEPPDVIVLDAQMPEMDGTAFLDVIRRYLRWQHLPVILLTGHDEGPHIRRAIELGVRKTFLKANYRLEELLECVELFAPSG